MNKNKHDWMPPPTWFCVLKTCLSRALRPLRNESYETGVFHVSIANLVG